MGQALKLCIIENLSHNSSCRTNIHQNLQQSDGGFI